MNNWNYDSERFKLIDYNIRDKQTNVRTQILYMISRTISMFCYQNLPDTIPHKELEKLLQINGYAGIIEHEGKLYAVTGGLGGEPDEYYQPTTLVVSNPYLKLNKTFKIGEDCVLIDNDPFRLGLIPLISRYTTLLNENELTMYLASIGKRLPMLVSANDDSTAESAKLVFKQLEEGTIGVVGENMLLDGLKSFPNNNTVNMSDLFEYHQYIKATMFNELGINSNFNMKRERLLSGEVEQTEDSLAPLVDRMMEHRAKGVKEMNEMFGTNVGVSFDSAWKYDATRGFYHESDMDFVDQPEPMMDEEDVQAAEEEVAEDITEEPTVEATPAEEVAEPAAEEPVEEPTEEEQPTEEPAEEPAEETVEEQTEEPTEEEEQPTEEETQETEEEPMEETEEDKKDEGDEEDERKN